MQAKGKIRWADVFLLGGILLVGCIFGLILLLNRHEGAQVQVRVAGTVVSTFSLAENRTCEIEGANGGTNLLVIQDKEAWVEEASCPDGLCVNMGKISHHGQSIICLPNQVVVEIIDSKTADTSEIDLLAG